ncbi:MAG: sigma-70 family RNA polymerase sigma factor [Sphingomonadales bacterium]|nr:sigma-70 family RNA polymerase sigma factor [Sphingomonadales bacterium]MDE2169309.1 sigma-70 family RNA polymerase sigma factor [Sphingomonadales bacterium]
MKADEASLARLAALAQRGNRAAYAAFLGECQRWLKRYFVRRVGAEFLDDLVQETLLSVHAKLASYDPARPVLPWLAAIARYRWVDQLRRIYKARESAFEDEVADDAEEPEIAARISLDRLFAYLPSGQVQAIELVKIEGLSVAEAAAASGQSESLVKVNIHRGLKKLATLIEKA